MTHLRQSAWKKALLAFALGSFGVLAFAQAASATHQTPVGASPIRVSLVPAYAPCTVPDQAHNLPLGFPSCSTASASPPTPRSGRVIWGPTSLGFARLVECNVGAAGAFCNPANPPAPNGVWAQPDIRITGNVTDLRCTALAPPCATPGTSPYNPTGGGHYTAFGNGSTAPTPPCFPSAPNPPGSTNPTCGTTTADATLTAQIPGSGIGSAVRITDHNNPSNPGTTVDSPFPVPVDCTPIAGAGSNCGVNTSANALVGGAVISGVAGDIEVGQAMMLDLTGAPFAVQGLFNP